MVDDFSRRAVVSNTLGRLEVLKFDSGKVGRLETKPGDLRNSKTPHAIIFRKYLAYRRPSGQVLLSGNGFSFVFIRWK